MVTSKHQSNQLLSDLMPASSTAEQPGTNNQLSDANLCGIIQTLLQKENSLESLMPRANGHERIRQSSTRKAVSAHPPKFNSELEYFKNLVECSQGSRALMTSRMPYD